MRRQNVLLTILLALIGMLFIWFGYSTAKSKVDYEQDVQYFYSLARKLGHNEGNHLKFNRNRAIGIDAAYDNLEILFHTDISYEEFSVIVSDLGFNGGNSYTPSPASQGFLYNPWDDLKSGLSLRHENNGQNVGEDEQIQPLVRKWLLYDVERYKSIKIAFAEPVNDEEWFYNNQILYGNIVQIEFDRY